MSAKTDEGKVRGEAGEGRVVVFLELYLTIGRMHKICPLYINKKIWLVKKTQTRNPPKCLL